jgi:hypothetical protein
MFFFQMVSISTLSGSIFFLAFCCSVSLESVSTACEKKSVLTPFHLKLDCWNFVRCYLQHFFLPGLCLFFLISIWFLYFFKLTSRKLPNKWSAHNFILTLTWLVLLPFYALFLLCRLIQVSFFSFFIDLLFA